MSAQLIKKHNIPCTAELAVGGVEIHKMIEQAFQAGVTEDGVFDVHLVAEHFAEHIPDVRPDIQPDAIRAAKWVAHELMDIHAPVIGVEKQIDMPLFPATKSREEVRLTTCVDLLLAGKNNSLHVWDWKTGWKKRSGEEARDCFQTCTIATILFHNYDGTHETALGVKLPKIDTLHFWYKEVRWGLNAYAKIERDTEDPQLPHLTTEVAMLKRVESAARLWLSQSQEVWPEPEKCAYCDAIYHCPMASMQIKEIAEDPCKAVDHLCVMEKYVKRLKSDLGKWYKKNGPVEGTEVRFDWIIPKPRFMPRIVSKTTQSDAESDDE
jgi:hypothetical protein